jgi:hypothetical protein
MITDIFDTIEIIGENGKFVEQVKSTEASREITYWLPDN